MAPLSREELRRKAVARGALEQAVRSMGSIYSKSQLKAMMSMPQVRQALTGMLPAGQNCPLPDETGGHVVLVPFESNLPVEWVGDEASFVVRPSISSNVQMTQSATVAQEFESPAFLANGFIAGGQAHTIEPVAEATDSYFQFLERSAERARDAEQAHTYVTHNSAITTTVGTSFSIGVAAAREVEGHIPQLQEFYPGSNPGPKYMGLHFAEGDFVSIRWECSSTAASNMLPYILTWNGSALVNTTITAVADNALTANVIAPAGTLLLLECGFQPSASSPVNLTNFSYTFRRQTGSHHLVHDNFPVGGDTNVITDRIRSIGGKARMVSLNAHLQYTGGFTEGGDIAIASVLEALDLTHNLSFNSMFQRVGSWCGNLTEGATGMWMPTAIESRKFTTGDGVIGDGGIIGYLRRDSSAQTARLIVKGVIEVQCNLKVHSPIPSQYIPPAWQAILFISSNIPLCFDNDNHVGRILQAIGEAITDFSPVAGLVAGAVPGAGAILGPSISAFGSIAGNTVSSIGRRVSGKPATKKQNKAILKQTKKAVKLVRN